MCVKSFQLFETHTSLRWTNLRPAGCNFWVQKHLRNSDPSGLFQPNMPGESFNNPDEKHTKDKERHWERHHWDVLFLGLRLCWTFCLWFLLSDWKLYNEQKSQVTCCNLYFLASVDGIKIQSGMLLRYASRIILQLPFTAGWACLGRHLCVRVHFLHFSCAGFISPIGIFCM